MNLRCLRISVLLILAFSIPCYGQSLGDVARQIRAERQEQGSHPAVITNDDLESTEPAPAVSPNAFQNETKNESEENAPAANSAEGTSKSTKGGKDSAKEREREIQKRSDEINKVYLDRIAALRMQINTARTELAKLQLRPGGEHQRFQADRPARHPISLPMKSSNACSTSRLKLNTICSTA